MSRIFRRILWTLVAVIGSLCLLAVLPSLFGLLLVALLVVCVVEFLSYRKRNAIKSFNSVLQTVAAYRGNLSSAAIAFSQSGPISGPAYEFARRLMMGQDPLEAAARARVPLHLSTAVALQSSSGSENANSDDDQQHAAAPTYSRISEQESFAEDSSDAILRGMSSATSVYGRLIYLCITVFVTLLVSVFSFVFIVPTMRMMFEEFNVDTDSFAYLLSTTPAYLLCVIVLLVSCIVITLTRSGNILGIPVPSWLPHFPSVARRKAELLHGLADAVDAGWPVGRALSIAHTITINGSQRSRLMRAMEWIEQGRSTAEAIQSAGWIDRRDVPWIEDAPERRLAPLLRTIADRGVRDSVFNLTWIMNIVFPLTILAIGTVITMYSYGFLSGLFEIMYQSAGQI